MIKDVKSLTRKELRKIVRELFKHFGRDEVYEDEFYDYFRRKGLSDEDIEVLWVRVIGESDLVRWEIHVWADELPLKEVKSRAYIKLISKIDY